MRKQRVSQREDEVLAQEERKRKHVGPKRLSHVISHVNLCISTKETPLEKPFVGQHVEAKKVILYQMLSKHKEVPLEILAFSNSKN